MKIKHQKEHDNIVSWISDNYKTFIENIGIIDKYSSIVINRQIEILSNKKNIGHFDIKISYVKEFDFDIDIKDTSNYERNKNVEILVIINVKLESSTEQLREMKKIINQYKSNSKLDLKKTYFVIVSENDQYKSFFTDENIIFYKF